LGGRLESADGILVKDCVWNSFRSLQDFKLSKSNFLHMIHMKR